MNSNASRRIQEPVFVAENQELVDLFLAQNPSIESEVVQAANAISLRLADTEFFLHVSVDPDSGETCLLLRVLRSKYVREEKKIFDSVMSDFVSSFEKFLITPIFSRPSYA